nr:HAD family hydrolase [Clostridium aestuarii]
MIYSRRLIEENDKNSVLVERYLGEELSFMKESVINKLKKLRNKVLFIPVTTRTIDQYNRIFGIKDEIKPKYAIVSNGGNILIDGQIDTEWRNKIKTDVDKIINYRFIEKRFLQNFKDTSWINKMIFRDGLFFSIHFKDKNLIDIEELENFKQWAEKNHWKVSLQTRKLYLVPEPVNKWSALIYIKNKEKKKKIISAGDSFLDYPLLINADYSICAAHGELKELIEKNDVKQKHITMTERIGINASEEIISIVENLV